MLSSIHSRILSFLERLTQWVSTHQRISRLIVLATGLLITIGLLSPSIRIVFWNNLLSHTFLASILFVFCLLAISLIWTKGQQVDTWAFLLFNVRGTRPTWLDNIMLGFTQIGSAFAALVFSIILYLLRNKVLAYELILGTLSLWIVVESAKFLIHRSRPFIRLTQTRIVGNQARGQSFPSGHTSQVFFMATLFAQFYHPNLWILWLLYTIALVVGITRMYVGAHYPRDVLAGAILGTAWGLLGVIINEYMLVSVG
jgi:membrane-associated phospholipid phosphatase